MDICARRLYLLSVTVDTTLGSGAGGAVQVDFLPVVGFATVGPSVGAPIIMPAGGAQVVVEAESTVSIDGAAPVPLPAYYDLDAKRFFINAQEYVSEQTFKQQILEDA